MHGVSSVPLTSDAGKTLASFLLWKKKASATLMPGDLVLAWASGFRLNPRYMQNSETILVAKNADKPKPSRKHLICSVQPAYLNLTLIANLLLLLDSPQPAPPSIRFVPNLIRMLGGVGARFVKRDRG